MKRFIYALAMIFGFAFTVASCTTTPTDGDDVTSANPSQTQSEVDFYLDLSTANKCAWEGSERLGLYITSSQPTQNAPVDISCRMASVIVGLQLSHMLRAIRCMSIIRLRV